MSRVKYISKSGQHLKFSVCRPDGKLKGAPLQPLPESETQGYYTANSPIDIAEGDTIVIYGPENVLYEGEPLTYEGDFVIVDETVGKGEFSAETQDLASTKQNDLTDTESNILEALGDSTLHGPELLKKAGYDSSSHYRAILSGLVKRNILDRNARGYHRK